MSLIGRVIGSFVGNALNKAHSDSQQSTNQKLGYDEVRRRIERRGRYIKILGVHLIIIFGLVIVFNFLEMSEFAMAFFGLWAIFVLVPHFFSTLIYCVRWSPKALDNLPRPFEKPKKRT